jgi:hypothetical protein
MKTTLLVGGLVLSLLVLNLHAQDVRLTFVLREGTFYLTHETAADKVYALQQSSDLNDWLEVEPATTGDGHTSTHEIVATVSGSRFFRLIVTPAAPTDLAPTETEAVELFVGATLEGYAFTSPTRFHWFGEGGEWSYQKTGPDTALVVFTYDEDGNNPQVYREHVLLTFNTANSGNYRYSEFNGGIEDPSSVSEAPFSL